MVTNVAMMIINAAIRTFPVTLPFGYSLFNEFVKSSGSIIVYFIDLTNS